MSRLENWIKTLTELLKPEEVIVTKANIVGYAWVEKTKTLYFLSREECESYDKNGLEWIRFGNFPKNSKEREENEECEPEMSLEEKAKTREDLYKECHKCPTTKMSSEASRKCEKTLWVLLSDAQQDSKELVKENKILKDLLANHDDLVTKNVKLEKEHGELKQKIQELFARLDEEDWTNEDLLAEVLDLLDGTANPLSLMPTRLSRL